MQICLCAISPQEAFDYCLHNLKKGDILCLHRTVIGRVDMQRELDGEDKNMLTLLRLSASAHCVIFAATRAYVGDECYNSVLAFDDGRILGVSDQIMPVKGFEPGSSLRCYKTGVGTIAVLVGDDKSRPQLWHMLAGADVDEIIVLEENVFTPLDDALMTAMSYCVGVNATAHFCDLSKAYGIGQFTQCEQGVYRKFDILRTKRQNSFIKKHVKLFVE